MFPSRSRGKDSRLTKNPDPPGSDLVCKQSFIHQNCTGKYRVRLHSAPTPPLSNLRRGRKSQEEEWEEGAKHITAARVQDVAAVHQHFLPRRSDDQPEETGCRSDRGSRVHLLECSPDTQNLFLHRGFLPTQVSPPHPSSLAVPKEEIKSKHLNRFVLFCSGNINRS
ncbi:hypothetical protein DPEC_G00320790 [Dallia pectoralis]|uniref:Uncharacterized protein n=1 Tax=Dallia pectoralis TaxID=75939 RepID=A0ACC2F9V6_DALPE|nr:hypothetical protein DPEC_G00320790 [Dallia pectoralis]